MERVKHVHKLFVGDVDSFCFIPFSVKVVLVSFLRPGCNGRSHDMLRLGEDSFDHGSNEAPFPDGVREDSSEISVGVEHGRSGIAGFVDMVREAGAMNCVFCFG